MRREPATERAGAAVARQFHEFCLARGHGMRFTAPIMNEFMTFYVASGYVARSLGKRNAELRTFARRHGCEFPAKESAEWEAVRRQRQALLKLDPTEEKHATVCHHGLLDKMRGYLHAGTQRELRSCAPWACQLVTRALLAHCCMLRGCEHADGMTVSDVELITDAYVVVRVNWRRSARKIKTRPARRCVVPRGLPAGQALVTYLQRFHARSDGSAVLFPARRSDGAPTSAPQTVAQLMTVMKAVGALAGFTQAELARLTAHSLRAGGTTDFFAAGLSEAFIREQGGWASDAVRGYNRPAAPHRWAMANSMVSAMRRVRDCCGSVRSATGWPAWRELQRQGRRR